jgi:hypothetical protein
MKNKILCFKTTVALLLVSAVLMLVSSPLQAADLCQVIRIEQEKGSGGTRLEIYPEKITVPVGTCTVWINWAAKQEVKVSFQENAKQCIISTEASTGFQELELKDGETCYVSESLPKGRTASLVWKKPGVYKYTLELGTPKMGGVHGGYTGIVKAQGVIEVK